MKLNHDFEGESSPFTQEVLKYEEFVKAFYAGMGHVVSEGSLKPKCKGATSGTTNPVSFFELPSVSTKPIAALRERLRPHGFWRDDRDMPAFGWAPVVFGWVIAIYERNEAPQNAIDNGRRTDCFVNGVRWVPTDGFIPWNGSRWAGGAT